MKLHFGIFVLLAIFAFVTIEARTYPKSENIAFETMDEKSVDFALNLAKDTFALRRRRSPQAPVPVPDPPNIPSPLSAAV